MLSIVEKFKAGPKPDPTADFKMGITAYRQGDYEVALEKWIPLAKKGAVEAQVNLGSNNYTAS